MTTEKPAALSARFLLRPRARFGSFARVCLVLVAFLLCKFSPAFAQAPQQYVYGSATTATPPTAISAFGKSSATGALSSISGSSFNERFESGLVAIDGQGRFLFVLNPISNDISMFQINQASGALSEVPGSPFTVPPTFNPSQAPSQPISIATEPSGKFLFVGYFFGDVQGESSVVSLLIDTSGPSPVLVTQQSSPLGTTGAPAQLLSDRNGLYLYVGLRRGQNAVPIGGARVFSIDSSSGNLGYKGTAATLNDDGLSYAIDPLGRFFYAAGQGNAGSVESCLISPVDGTAAALCQPIFYLGMGHFATAMVTENSGHFLYVSDNGIVEVYSIEQNTGALNLVSGPLSGITLLQSSVADPIGPYIYSGDDPGIRAYQVDPQSGNLTEIPNSPFSTGAANPNCCGGLAITGAPAQAVSGPAATIFPPNPVNFGSLTVGATSPTQIVSLVNIGNQLLAISSISIAGANISSFSETNTCTPTLAPNANCSVSITFSPQSAGALTASLQIGDNAPGSPQTLVLSGAGLAPSPAVTFSPPSPSFPATTQGTSSAPQTLTVVNSGTAPLHVASVSLNGANPSDFSFANNCSAPVAPTFNCTISLLFSPIAPGQRLANLMISDDAPASPQTIALSATANPAFTAGVAPGGSTMVSISAGQTAQFQLQLTPGSGFTGTVSLACSGAPLGAMCQVPASISLANEAATPFTVTVATSGSALAPPFARFRIPPISRIPLLTLPGLALLLVLLFVRYGKSESVSGRTRLAFSRVLAAFLCAIALIGVAGCGGGNASVAPPPIITPSGNSVITVTPSAMSPTGQALQLTPIQLTLTVK